MWPLVESAYAMAPGGGGGDGASVLGTFAPLIMVFAIFWFLVIRPQQKRAKEHRNLVANLKEGDEVVTDGGIYGTLRRVPENAAVVTLEIASKITIRIDRSRIAGLTRETRGKDTKDKDKEPASESASESDGN